jgi:hypothetical protein
MLERKRFLPQVAKVPLASRRVSAILYHTVGKQTNTHTRKQQKITKENSTGTKHKWKTCRVLPREKKGQKTSEADSFRHMKIKISYTPADGHVGRNM